MHERAVGRGVVVGLPAIAMLIVSFALLGPGRVRKVTAVRLWGGPTVGMARLSFRIQGIERVYGIDTAARIERLSVDVRSLDGARGSWSGEGGTDGVADVEVLLDRPANAPLWLTVTSPDGAPLAVGSAHVEARTWDGEPMAIAELGGISRGGLELRMAATRGLLSSPFDERVRVDVARDGIPVPNATVQLVLLGGEARRLPDDSEGAIPVDHHQNPFELSPAVTFRTDGTGGVEAVLTPLSHWLSATVAAWTNDVDRTVRSGDISVVPGGMWLDPDALERQVFRVVSSVPRTVAYLNVSREGARLWGGTLPLHLDATGFSSGEMPRPNFLDEMGPGWLTLASDPGGLGAATIGWPIGPAPHATDVSHGQPRQGKVFRDALWLDGAPYVEQVHHRRVSHARLLALAALLAAALLEGIVLVAASRAHERQFRAHVVALRREASGWGGAGDLALISPFHRVIVAIATLVFAFAAVGVFVLWKTS